MPEGGAQKAFAVSPLGQEGENFLTICRPFRQQLTRRNSFGLKAFDFAGRR
jgi:hypothetical protein